MSARRFAVRRSPIHGRGVFALGAITRGERLLDYTGERIAWDEACRRYEESGTLGHTFFFDIGDDRVIDGGSRGSAARWLNHGCAPNCEATLEGSRIVIAALDPIAPGEELTIDYRLVVDDPDDVEVRAVYACRCGSPACRGAMLAP